MNKVAQKRECQDCGATFMGNPRSRYCPKCREKRREASLHVPEQPAKTAKAVKAAPATGSKLDIFKKYLSFTRLAVLNVIFLAFGLWYAWYLNKQPFSMDTQAKLEAFAPSNMALITLLILGSGVRFLYRYKDKKSDNPFWRDNYWKQLLMWLLGLVVTEGMALYCILS